MISEEFCGEDVTRDMGILKEMKRLTYYAISESILTDEVTTLNIQKALSSNREIWNLETCQTGYAGSDKKLNRETMGTKQNTTYTILDEHRERMEHHGQQIYLIGLQLEN